MLVELGWWSYGWVYSFNKNLPVCVENSVFGGEGGDGNRANEEALEISPSRAGMLVTWPSGGCGEGEK